MGEFKLRLPFADSAEKGASLFSSRWILATLLCVSLLPLGSAVGNSSKQCELASHLNHLLKLELETGALDPSDYQVLKRIFRNTDLSSKERAKRAYEYVLEARLSRLSPELAVKVRKLLAERLDVEIAQGFNWTGLINGWFRPHLKNPENSVLALKVVPEAAGTYLEYAIQLHELEHAIQFLKRPDRKLAKSKYDVFQAIYTENVLLEESLSFRREWEYLHQLPIEEKRALIQELRRSRIVEKGDREWVESCMLNSCVPLQNYLKEQMERRGYVAANVEASRLEKRAETIKFWRDRGAFAGAIAFGGWMWARNICEKYRQTPGRAPDSKFDRYFCQPADRLLGR